MSGNSAAPNRYGIWMRQPTTGNVIGGANGRNVISGNSSDGIRVDSVVSARSSGNLIRNNWIGQRQRDVLVLEQENRPRRR